MKWDKAGRGDNWEAGIIVILTRASRNRNEIPKSIKVGVDREISVTLCGISVVLSEEGVAQRTRRGARRCTETLCDSL